MANNLAKEIVSTNSSNNIYKPFCVISRKYLANEELKSFYNELVVLRLRYKYDDCMANSGLVISPTLDARHDNPLSVKLVIETQLSVKPVSFTCNVDTSVEHIISHVICTLVDNPSNVKIGDFLLKVYGLAEYLAPNTVLANYSYVHKCHKFDTDVHLGLVGIKDLSRPFARTLRDDKNIDFTVDDIMPKAIVCKFGELSTETINILLESFDREISTLRSDARGGGQLQSQSIIEMVKAICAHLSTFETIDITKAVTNLSQVCNTFGTYKPDSITGHTNNTKLKSMLDFDTKSWDILDQALLKLQTSLIQLIRLYSQTFPVEFDISSDLIHNNKKKVRKDLSSINCQLFCQIGVCCQLQPKWLTTYKEFIIRFELIHGNHKLSGNTTKPVCPSEAFFNRLSFDEYLPFYCPIVSLPREVKLILTLIGIKSSDDIITHKLGVGSMYLFDYNHILANGQYLIPLWINSTDFCIESDAKLINSMCFEKTNPIVEISFPETDFETKFPPIIWDQTSDTSAKLQQNFTSLDTNTQTELFHILNRNPLEPMSSGDREQLWDRRYYLYECAEAFPKVLLASHTWESTALSDIYAMVQHWAPLSPIDSMQLLLPSYPDIHIRQMTVQWLKKLSSDELCDFMPQLVQSLRFDAYIDSELIWFLLESSLSSVRVCHHLYWILKCNINDQTFTFRSRLYLNALQAIVGESTNQMFDRQEGLSQSLSSICVNIKSAKESQRLDTLLVELESVNNYLIENPTVLPLSPSMGVCGFDVKLCAYYPSNSLPLKLIFQNPDTKTLLSSLQVLFKTGDDLRHDMLSIQMIQIMDKLWLKEGLDLRIITFGCVATDYRKGMIEMVGNSKTLRKIQSKHGLTCAFKDRPIAQWLQKHSTSESEYNKAVNNFTYSCAGYLVATYLLGICDQNKDNIMLTNRGHLFCTNFANILGNSQIMGDFKKDSVGIVLTQDMAYVINGGDKPSKQFQFFVDLCCQAFNVLRKNSNFLVSLLSLTMSSRITGLNAEAVQYIHKALMPGVTELEAMSQFILAIEKSVSFRFTKCNFLIQSLRKFRFTGDHHHNQQMMLLFTPKTTTNVLNSLIANLEVIGCYKKYETQKIYYFVVRVKREFISDPNYYIHRTYEEFIELNEKLNTLYPIYSLAKFHILSRPSKLISFNTKNNAFQRLQDIQHFINGLMLMPREISHSDIVYTFFNTFFIDQEGANQTRLTWTSGNFWSTRQTVGGQLKLLIVYRNISLVIVIMQAKDLVSVRSGSAPDTYVQTYLNPDPMKVTKRKTRLVNKTSDPTFMEMIVYRGIPIEKLQQKTLQVSIWDYERVTKNLLIGKIHIMLSELDLKNETCGWFALQENLIN